VEFDIPPVGRQQIPGNDHPRQLLDEQDDALEEAFD
jgi:hypothetical protein